MAGPNITITVNAQTSDAVAKLQTFVNGMQSGLNRLAGASGFLQGLAGKIAAAFSIGSLVTFTKDAIDAADEMSKLAQKTGVSTEALSGLSHAANLSDVSVGELQLGLKSLAENAANAAGGSKEAQAAFERAGISFRNADGSIRPVDTLFFDLADKLKRMPDGVGKTSIALDLLGRSGQNTIPMLNMGADGLRDLTEEARAAGLVISAETGAAAEEFNDTLTRMKGSVQGVFLRLAEALLPILQSIAKRLQEASQSADKLNVVLSAVVFAVRSVTVVLVGLWTGLKIIYELIKGQVVTALEMLSVGYASLIKVGNLFIDTIGAIVGAMLRLGSTARDVASVLAKFFTGDFIGAKNEAVKIIGDIEKEISGLAGKVAGNATQAVGIVGDTAAWMQNIIATKGKQTTDKIVSDAQKAYSFLLDLFDKKPAAAKTDATPSNNDGSDESRDTNQAQKFLDEINQKYQQQFASKQQLLKDEYEANLLRLQQEVKDEEAFNNAKSQLHSIYEAQKRKLAEENAAALTDIALAQISAQRQAIENDPDISVADKKQQLLPLLAEENRLVAERIRLAQERMTNPDTDDATKIEINRELLRLEKERYELNLKRKAIESDNFSGHFDKMVQGVNDGYASGLTQAQKVMQMIQTSINSISQSMTGLIMGTMTWGQALNQIGTTIMQTVIQGFIQIMLEQTIFAALRETLRVQETASEAAHVATRTGIHAAGEGSKTGATMAGSVGRGIIRVGETVFHGVQVAIRVAKFIAAEGLMTAVTIAQTALRLPVIIMETGKYLIQAAIKAGNAVAGIPFVGPVLAIAAMGTIIAGGLKLMGAFKEGGYTGDGDPNEVAGIVHKREVVIPAGKVGQFGRGFFENIVNGGITPESLTAGLARPITSNPNIGQMLPGIGGGASPNVTVNTPPTPPAQVTVHLFEDDRKLVRKITDNGGDVQHAIIDLIRNEIRKVVPA